MGEDKVELAREEAEKLPCVEINQLDLQWLQVLSEGWASPLTGKLKKSKVCYLAGNGKCRQDGRYKVGRFNKKTSPICKTNDG